MLHHGNLRKSNDLFVPYSRSLIFVYYYNCFVIKNQKITTSEKAFDDGSYLRWTTWFLFCWFIYINYLESFLRNFPSSVLLIA
ncbi:hypothetical protein BpHYR1_006977 [Brachionus plicatilis]|uniref:Uncharacterized protein n=1 Tax=Brachionus plicatilis TaxID=10195 RepID=A0A3M7P5X1_BRAPC|nr:hypothetical protein BpHYR1_006977 [Brachionus plicatilis]